MDLSCINYEKDIMEKKIVHYDKKKGVSPIMNRMILFPIDHPDNERVSNTQEAVTSTVVSWDEESGRIETQNTIYLPKEV
jgi:hypothetical protein